MDSSGYDVAGHPIETKQAVQLLDRLVALQEISLKASRRTEFSWHSNNNLKMSEIR